MNDIGVVICNFNKAAFVVDCVKAVKNQTLQGLDIYVVDNASTDDSVQRLTETYGDSITIIQNPENVGGSGGFQAGIMRGIKEGYKYLMLVDNDAMLDSKAIEYLYAYLEKHPEAGFCGAETLNLQKPDLIQDLGGFINYDSYFMNGIIGGTTELAGTAILETDYVASCALLCRTEILKQIGGMPVENFIYWDDVEMCTKCRQLGYKVIVNGYAKAYHDLSEAGVQNMFFTYYANRNRYKYFTRYLPEERLNDFYDYITKEVFARLYGSIPKGMYGTAFTYWGAFDDFMHGIAGKAKEGRIVPYTAPKIAFSDVVTDWKKVLVYMPVHNAQYYQILQKLMRYLLGKNSSLEIVVTYERPEKEGEYDKVFWLTNHVSEVSEQVLPFVYADRLLNFVTSKREYDYFTSYEAALANFRAMYRSLFEERVKELRRTDK